jgi:hypothetical protein
MLVAASSFPFHVKASTCWNEIDSLYSAPGSSTALAEAFMNYTYTVSEMCSTVETVSEVCILTEFKMNANGLEYEGSVDYTSTFEESSFGTLKEACSAAAGKLCYSNLDMNFTATYLGTQVDVVSKLISMPFCYGKSCSSTDLIELNNYLESNLMNTTIGVDYYADYYGVSIVNYSLVVNDVVCDE